MISDDEVGHLKPWLIQKLKVISEADSEILSDYVVALLQADDRTEAALRLNAAENLTDFLGNHTRKFVEDVFQVIRTKAYLPGHQPVKAQVPAKQPQQANNMRSNANSLNKEGRKTTGKRKRGQNGQSKGIYVDWDAPSLPPSCNKKQQRTRDDNATRLDALTREEAKDYRHLLPSNTLNHTLTDHKNEIFEAHGGGRAPKLHHPSISKPVKQQITDHSMVVPPMDKQTFDPDLALQALMTLSAMGFPLPPPDMVVNLNQKSQSNQSMRPWIPSNKRCRDYDTAGTCARGTMCYFRHIDDMADSKGQGKADVNGESTERRRLLGTSSKKGPSKAAFSSQLSDGFKQRWTAIVVEHIPEEAFDEETIKAHFIQFGEIQALSTRPYHRLAIVQYYNHDDARAAITSPKVIFNNRFVKVFWYNAALDVNVANGDLDISAAICDSIKYSKVRGDDEWNAEAAQKRYEARQVLIAETEEKLQELHIKLEEVEKRKAEEIQKIKDAFAIKGKPLPPDVEELVESQVDKTGTEQLLAQLKALEDEAQSLGIDADLWYSDPNGFFSSYSHRGHSSPYRGSRGSLRGRNRGRVTHYKGTVLADGAYNLDNRPRQVQVEGVDFDTEKEECLKQHLYTFGENFFVEAGSDTKAVVVAFEDRPTAEAFFYGARDIPGVGKVSFSWVANPVVMMNSRGHIDMLGPNASNQDSQSRDADREEGESSDRNDRDDGYGGDDYEWIT